MASMLLSMAQANDNAPDTKPNSDEPMSGTAAVATSKKTVDDIAQEEYLELNSTLGKMRFEEQQARMEKIKQEAADVLGSDFASKTADERRACIDLMSPEKQRPVLRMSALHRVIQESQQTQKEMQAYAQKFSELIPSMPAEMIAAQELKLRERAMKVLPANFFSLDSREQSEAISNVPFEKRNAVMLWNTFSYVARNIFQSSSGERDDCCRPTGGWN